jgi:hypothetical protein
MSYGSNWHGSGQIPDRAVQQGLISRYGSIDPDEGGNTARHQLFAQYRLQPSENSQFEALAYLGNYRFNLFSNFTLYLNNPDRGDEIEQVDRRTFFGGRTSYRVIHELGGMRFDTLLGAGGRNDDIHAELWNTSGRVRQSAANSNDIHETFVGAYVNEEVRLLRTMGGTPRGVIAVVGKRALLQQIDATPLEALARLREEATAVRPQARSRSQPRARLLPELNTPEIAAAHNEHPLHDLVTPQWNTCS